MDLFRWVPGKGPVQVAPKLGVASLLPSDGPLREAPCLLVLPPLWDHHGHVAWLGALLEQADLRGCSSVDEALNRLVREAAGPSPGAWAEGFGWDQNLWGGVYPGRASLDRLFPSRPVYLRRVDGHAAWVNSAALAAAGIGEDAPDPPGGAFLRDGGRLSGILLDTAMERVAAHVPDPSFEDLRRRVLNALNHLLGAGLAGVTDMGLEPAHVDVLASLDREGALPLPVEGFAWVRPGQRDLPAPATGSRFHLRGIKLFADGALGSRGAALREPYSDATGTEGFLLWETEEMARVLKEARAAGLVPAVHAIGDRAVGQVLDAAAMWGTAGVRIEHAQLVSDGDVRRMAALGLAAGIQPCHYLSDRSWAGKRLGGRMSRAYRWGSLLRAGVPLRMGTDFPIEPPDPARNFLAAAGREDPSERLSVEDVLRAYAPPHQMDPAFACTLLGCEAPEALGRTSESQRLVFAPPPTGDRPC